MNSQEEHGPLEDAVDELLAKHNLSSLKEDFLVYLRQGTVSEVLAKQLEEDPNCRVVMDILWEAQLEYVCDIAQSYREAVEETPPRRITESMSTAVGRNQSSRRESNMVWSQVAAIACVSVLMIIGGNMLTVFTTSHQLATMIHRNSNQLGEKVDHISLLLSDPTSRRANGRINPIEPSSSQTESPAETVSPLASFLVGGNSLEAPEHRAYRALAFGGHHISVPWSNRQAVCFIPPKEGEKGVVFLVGGAETHLFRSVPSKSGSELQTILQAVDPGVIAVEASDPRGLEWFVLSEDTLDLPKKLNGLLGDPVTLPLTFPSPRPTPGVMEVMTKLGHKMFESEHSAQVGSAEEKNAREAPEPPAAAAAPP